MWTWATGLYLRWMWTNGAVARWAAFVAGGGAFSSVARPEAGVLEDATRSNGRRGVRVRTSCVTA